MIKNVFLIGAGGHSKVLLDNLLLPINSKLSGIIDTHPNLSNPLFSDLLVFNSEEEFIKNFSPSNVYLINGIGHTGSNKKRQEIYQYFKIRGYDFLSVKHPISYQSIDMFAGEGCQFIAGSIVQPGCSLGNNVIINTKASIDHDCRIGNHVHIAPGAICCGNVSIGDSSFIGSGSVIIQGVTIGKNCLVGAGAVVVNNIEDNSKVFGVPAKVKQTSDLL